LDERRVVSEVVLLLERQRREDEADCAGREVLDLSPDEVRNVEAVVRTVQCRDRPARPIIEDHVKAPGHGNDDLLERSMSVPCARRTARDVVHVEDALYLEGDVTSALDWGQIAA